MFALGLMSWLYHRARPRDARVPREEVREARRTSREANIKRVPRPATRSARRRRRSPSRTRSKPATLAPGTYRNITGQPGARATGSIAASKLSRAAALPRRVPDHARVGDPRGARAAQELRRPHVPGRGRDRGRRRRGRRVVRRRARRLHVSGAGHRAEAGDDRARDHARAAAADPRHPARGPVDTGCRRSRSRPTC